jgi:hypothetical protein
MTNSIHLYENHNPFCGRDIELADDVIRVTKGLSGIVSFLSESGLDNQEVIPLNRVVRVTAYLEGTVGRTFRRWFKLSLKAEESKPVSRCVRIKIQYLDSSGAKRLLQIDCTLASSIYGETIDRNTSEYYSDSLLGLFYEALVKRISTELVVTKKWIF